MSKQETNLNDLYVVVISSREERDQLKSLCVKHNIPLTYPELFKEEKIQNLWGIDKSGVALVGTVVAQHMSEDHVINSLVELEKIIINNLLK